jgi:excisionase family DNA binding protein
MEPITVRPKDAFAALGIGVTKGYELINAGELETIKIGRATRITVTSVRALVERRINHQSLAA